MFHPASLLVETLEHRQISVQLLRRGLASRCENHPADSVAAADPAAELAFLGAGDSHW